MLSYHVWVHVTNLLSSPNQSSQLHPGVALYRRKMHQWQRVNEAFKCSVFIRHFGHFKSDSRFLLMCPEGGGCYTTFKIPVEPLFPAKINLEKGVFTTGYFLQAVQSFRGEQVSCQRDAQQLQPVCRGFCILLMNALSTFAQILTVFKQQWGKVFFSPLASLWSASCHRLCLLSKFKQRFEEKTSRNHKVQTNFNIIQLQRWRYFSAWTALVEHVRESFVVWGVPS